MSYKLLDGGGVQRLSDMAFIPEDVMNIDWREYLEWVAKGNKPAPAHTAEEIEAATQEALIQAKIREIAVTELKKEGKLAPGYKS